MKLYTVAAAAIAIVAAAAGLYTQSFWFGAKTAAGLSVFIACFAGLMLLFTGRFAPSEKIPEKLLVVRVKPADQFDHGVWERLEDALFHNYGRAGVVEDGDPRHRTYHVCIDAGEEFPLYLTMTLCRLRDWAARRYPGKLVIYTTGNREPFLSALSKTGVFLSADVEFGGALSKSQVFRWPCTWSFIEPDHSCRVQDACVAVGVVY